MKTVIKNVEKLKSKHKEARNLITYYTKNMERMDYAQYKKIGIGLIGSGAIESAHRTVIQERMKLSGQRWTKKGAQNMLNLRVTNNNKQWSKITDLTKIDFIEKAG